MSHELNIVNRQYQYPKVSLIEPSSSVYIHIGAEIDNRPAILPSSRSKKALMAQCRAWCDQLRETHEVIDAAVFNVVLIPPERDKYLKEWQDQVHIARFDFVVLIECESAEAAGLVQRHPTYEDLVAAVRDAASYIYETTATNVRRIGPVDHSRPGVFLFNYFVAEDVGQNIAIWDYTAAWFQVETALDNSTLLRPVDNGNGQSTYSVINHCR